MKNRSKNIIPQIEKILVWINPVLENKHAMPYGRVLVTDGQKKENCKTMGDLKTERGPQYIVFNRKKYRVINNGSTEQPMLVLAKY